MMIPNVLGKAFNKAITNPDNFNEDGTPNWNYVDADVYMDIPAPEMNKFYGPGGMGTKEFYAAFEYLCDIWMGKYTVRQVRENRNHLPENKRLTLTRKSGIIVV